MSIIKLRRGNAAEWTTANSILAPGEPGVETDTGKYKIGDGAKTFGQLPYYLSENHTEQVITLEAFGAKGDGVTDDTVAFRAAIAASKVYGFVIGLKNKTYVINGALTIHSGLRITGLSVLKSVVKQTSTTANAFEGVDIDSFSMFRLQVLGPGRGVGSGCAIKVTRNTRGNTYRWDMRDLWLRSFGLDGIDVSNLIISEFSMVISEEMGRHGFNIHGVSGGSAGTSVVFNSCYGNGCLAAGFHIDTMVYMTFNACASDSCGIAYEIIGAANHTQGLSFNACGYESPENRSANYPGIGFKIEAGFGITFSGCWSFLNRAIAYWVTGGAQNIVFIGCSENSPTASATASFKVDSGCSAVIIAPSYEKEPVISNGATARGLYYSDTYFQRSVGIGQNPSGVAGDLTVANILRLTTASILMGASGDTGLYRAGTSRLGTDGSMYMGGSMDLYGGIGVGMQAPAAGSVSISNVLNLPYGAQINFGPDCSLYRAGVDILQTDDKFVAYSVRTAQFSSSQRPQASTLGVGSRIYDNVLRKPLWSDGNQWRDAAGTAV